MGQETEYAIRFSPDRAHPGNDRIYQALALAIGRQVRTEPGMYAERPQIFMQNGGAFHYEYLPYRMEGGLIEGATPECRGPGQLLLYQKAQESLLRKAIPQAEQDLGSSGFPGRLGLLKNCRDAEGHVYGAQESFECRLATGPVLWIYRLGLTLLMPLLAATVVLGWLVFIALLVAAIVVGAATAIVTALPPFRHHRWFARLTSLEDHKLENLLGRFLYWLSYVMTLPVIAGLSLLLRVVAFRRVRQKTLAFLVSRPVLSGSGSVEPDGRFVLSEKAPAIKRRMRFSISPNDRAIFDTGNLMKPALAAAQFHIFPLLSLFRRRQRLQLGLADSSMLEDTEFLKMGTTALVIDMAEAGWLRDAPKLQKPIAALHVIAGDPSLEAVVRSDRGEVSALELQRYYLEKAKGFLSASKTTSLEASEVVEQWEDVLVALEHKEMSRLVGRLDWVTKRYLLEACGDENDLAMLKTIDLRYHELEEGYADKFAATGNVHRLLAPSEIERAISEPPEGTPAFTRGRFIRSRAPHLTPVSIAWDSALIGGRIRGKLIRFPGPES